MLLMNYTQEMRRRDDFAREIHRLTPGQALSRIEKLLQPADRSIRLKKERADDTYRRMLMYMAQGGADPNRDTVVSSLAEEILRMNDEIFIARVKDEAPGQWWSAMRVTGIVMPDLEAGISQAIDNAVKAGLNPADNDAAVTRDKLYADLFDAVWTAYHLKPADANALQNLLTDPSAPADLRVIIASAIVAGSMKVYDRAKLQLMLRLIAADAGADAQEESPLHESALIMLCGLTLNMLLYSGRIEDDIEIREKVELLLSRPEVVADVKLISRELLRTIDTDRARRKMNEEVIPGLMQMRPDILKRMRDVSFDADVASIEENPEWAEMLDKSGIREQLEQLSEMQTGGADLMMAAFANLKNFPFFRRAGNWFIPYSPEHSEVKGVVDDIPAGFGDLLGSSLLLCDSDKYSLVLSMARMPEVQRKALFAQLSAQFEQLGESKEFKQKLDDERTNTLIIKSFMMRLYRFMKLYESSDAATGTDLFASPFDFVAPTTLWSALADEEFINLVAEFYFSRGMYPAALPYFEQLEAAGNMQVMEKMGYCCQKTGDFARAYECYEKGALVNPGSRWLTRRRAQVAARTGRFDEAAAHYETLLADNPADKNLLMHRANALYAAGKIADALQVYYNLSFLDEEDFNSRRAIAWCELLLDHYDKSHNEYAQLLLSQPIGSDWLNAGHLALLQGNMKEALGYYREALRLSGVEAFDKEILDDLPTLSSKGIDRRQLSLIRDCVVNSIG